MKTIVILGAAGRFGEACARAFLDAGWNVRGVARGAKTDTLLDGVEAVNADALEQEAIINACAGSDVILHGLNPTYDKWDELVLPMGRNVLAAARATGADVMLVGNVYNFGTSIGTNMDEAAPMKADVSKGIVRNKLEALFEDAEDVRTTIIRAGDFFGGRRRETWLDLVILKELEKDVFRWPGDYDLAHAFAYLPDLAQAFVRVADIRSQLNRFEVLHFEGHTLTGNQMKAATQNVVGRPLKSKKVPWWLLRIVGVFNPVIKGVCEMSYLWHTAHSLNGEKLSRFIDLQSHNIDDALRDTIVVQQLDKKSPASEAGL